MHELRIVDGPVEKERPRQVPEGLYRLTWLNPNSAYHLSIKIDYPNAFDRRMAEREGRTNLGGDIFIHGGRASIGCIAMGDEVIEELFTLVQETGLSRCRITIAPTDLRRRNASTAGFPAWSVDLYARIREDLLRRRPPAPPAPPPAGH